jgi:cell division protein FtsW (lipid II flippase)
MSMTPQDRRKLQWPIISLVLAIMIVGLLVTYADQYRAENDAALQTQH